jgi:hypothetical protein
MFKRKENVPLIETCKMTDTSGGAWMRNGRGVLLVLGAVVFAEWVGAADAPPEKGAGPSAVPIDPPSALQGRGEGVSVSAKPKDGKPSLSGKKLREKEAEGTEALNRFESESFIKSRYEFNGQALEVDTD